MSKRVPVGFMAVALLGFSAALASAQPVVPVKQLPPGFTIVVNTASKTSIAMSAEKPNAGKPQIAVDADIHIGYSWRILPGFARVVETMASSPEDPEYDQGTIKDEPAGKLRLKGGVLTFRKHTVLQVGTNGGPWVTYDAVWQGDIDGGMLAISVMNYAGPKADIQPWIEALIPAGKAK